MKETMNFFFDINFFVITRKRKIMSLRAPFHHSLRQYSKTALTDLPDKMASLTLTGVHWIFAIPQLAGWQVNHFKRVIQSFMVKRKKVVTLQLLNSVITVLQLMSDFVCIFLYSLSYCFCKYFVHTCFLSKLPCLLLHLKISLFICWLLIPIELLLQMFKTMYTTVITEETYY